MNNNLLVSVCCITYNHGPYIRQCLNGMLMQQTNFAIEILIHDDASTDDTADIIREYEVLSPHIIKPIYQKENQYSKGVKVGAVYNYSRAQGKYIAICEGDDYWTDPLKLQKQVDYLEAHEECGLVHTLAKGYIQGKNQYTDRLFGKDVPNFESLFESNTICTLTTCYRKKLMTQFYCDIDYQTQSSWLMGDLPLWLYISLHSNIHFINEVTGVYRILNESASHSSSLKKRILFLESSYSISVYFATKYNKKNLLPRRRNRILYLEMIAYINYNKPVPISIIKDIQLQNLQDMRLYMVGLLSHISFVRRKLIKRNKI